MMITEQPDYINILGRFIMENQKLLGRLKGRSLLLTGATGMIGSFLIDVLMYMNRELPVKRRVKVIALSRNGDVAKERFACWRDIEELHFFSCDIAKGLPQLPVVPDYYIHAASTTHPVAYATEPVNTVLANVLGVNALLEYMAKVKRGKLLLLSSVEIYGDNRGDVERFDESYCGYIDCNTLRAGYQEAKRVSESLCQAYIKQNNVNVCIIRLPRIYGPTMRLSDSKASSQFIKNGLHGKDIVLKSQGTQFFSYAYVYDAVSGMLCALFEGTTGEAYNLGAENSDITLRDLAQVVACYAGTRVVFKLPDSVEKEGFSTATKALMDSSKLRKLGWQPRYDIHSGIQETLTVMCEVFC